MLQGVWSLILFDQFYLLLQWHSQSKNGLTIPNFVYIFPDITRKYLSFPKCTCKGTGSFPKLEVKTQSS